MQQVYRMKTNEEYVERLEKIIEKQDGLLSQLDAKFKQQDSINESIIKQNNFLKGDIQKHKDLTRDMNKTVVQQKNVVEKLKKELEDQLKLQQELHKDYGEIIKQLTDDLEEEQDKNDKLMEKQNQLESKIKKLEDDLTKAKNDAKNIESDYYTKLIASNSDSTSPDTQNSNKKKCPNCGSEIEEGFLFCEACGTKL